MSKNYKKIVVAALCLIMVFVFAACQKAIKGGDPNADVYGNGSLVVRQGNYLYFVNGMTTAEEAVAATAKKYSGAVKGAILRAELGADGNVKVDADGNITNVETIVPQALFTSYTEGGLYIFGEWIYYVTPNASLDKSGGSLTHQVIVMRTKIDGTKTKKIATIKLSTTDSTSFKYKVTKDSFIYLEGTVLKKIDLSKSFKTTTIAEDVSNFIIPKNLPAYKVNDTAEIYDVIFTVNSDEKVTSLTHNEIKATNGNNTVTLLSGKAYFTSGDWIDNLDKIYNYTPYSAYYEGSDLVLYTGKTKLSGSGNNVDQGAFAYKFESANSYAFNLSKTANVKWLSATALSATLTPLGFATGVLYNDTALRYYKGAVASTVPEGDFDNYLNANAKALKVYYTTADVRYIQNTAAGQYDIFYITSTSGGALKKGFLDLNVGAADDDDFVKSGNEQTLITVGVVASWFVPVFDGGYIYFINSENYNYIYRASLTLTDGYISKNEGFVRIGKFTDADQKAYDVREAAKEK
ncbi:MAG: hypothetical protein LBT30_07450 [Clostridiales bacterium]|jgi:hypothetical protein|nr:hypothetical protein [Clostridiales bacterium]